MPATDGQGSVSIMISSRAPFLFRFRSSLPTTRRLPQFHPSGLRLRASIAVQMSSLESSQLDATPPNLAAYMDHINYCNRGSEERSQFIPFVVDNVAVGFVHPRFVQHLMCFPKVFAIMGEVTTHDDVEVANVKMSTHSFVTLHHELKSKEERTIVINRALKVLSAEGVIPGWRDELYPVVKNFGASPFFSLERAAVPYFGTKAYGVHINGYVSKPNGGKYLWVARRSMAKQTYPGMLDHLVAGGQPEGLSCKENVIKECDEEASIPKALAERASSVGAVSYEEINGLTMKRDVLFCYDLELPPEFQPNNKDGEVDSFTLLPVTEVEKILQMGRNYKPNCALVVIDFLVRHGYITADQDGYLHLLQSLRKGDCS